jgi:hypothetical protein
MEFSRHLDVRAERLDQIARVLDDLYPLLPEALPTIIAEKLEQLERAELCSNLPTNPE